jgi:hypothetical protein
MSTKRSEAHVEILRRPDVFRGEIVGIHRESNTSLVVVRLFVEACVTSVAYL